LGGAHRFLVILDTQRLALCVYIFTIDLFRGGLRI
jgi:hypothetical protein